MNHEVTESRPAYGNATAALGQELAGKYMSFKLAAEEYGLAILKVREIIGMMDITRVPQTSPFVRGVINLRGKVIPVLDLRRKFGLEAGHVDDQQSAIIVTQLAMGGTELTMGILVDEVLEVLDIRPEQIEPTPDFGGGAAGHVDFVLGIGKVQKRLVFLLDLDQVLSTNEVREVHAAASSEKHA